MKNECVCGALKKITTSSDQCMLCMKEEIKEHFPVECLLRQKRRKIKKKRISIEVVILFVASATHE